MGPAAVAARRVWQHLTSAERSSISCDEEDAIMAAITAAAKLRLFLHPAGLWKVGSSSSEESVGKLPGTGLMISWVRFLRPSGSVWLLLLLFPPVVAAGPSAAGLWLVCGSGAFSDCPGEAVGLVSPEASSVRLLLPG